jgi:hypothetical protein
MRNLLNYWLTKAALLLGISIASTGIAGAQAAVTAARGAEISPFVMTTLLHPDWGSSSNTGFIFGADYTNFSHALLTFQPSLELRMVDANGVNVKETSYLGGFKLATTIHGIQPYATLLGGQGYITFNHPIGNYTGDDSFVYSLGGGVEFNILPVWKVRADFTQQHWNLDPQVFAPTSFSVGLSYTIGLHGRGIAY